MGSQFTIKAVCAAFEPLRYVTKFPTPNHFGHCDKCGMRACTDAVELDGKVWYLCSAECAMKLYREYLQVFWIERRAGKTEAA